MSFRCGVCNEAQDPRVTPVMLVTEWREVTYPERRKGKKVIDRGGNGWEIVREVAACAKCANIAKGQNK